MRTPSWSRGNASRIAAAVGGGESAPVNTVAPVITHQGSPGSTAVPTEGDTMECSPGTWTGSPTPDFTYQWHVSFGSGADGDPIPGQTANSITLDPGTVSTIQGQITVEEFYLYCVVTGTNSQGSADGRSDDTALLGAENIGPVHYSPNCTVAPTATDDNGGDFISGETATAEPGTWVAYPAITGFAYEWLHGNPTPDTAFAPDQNDNTLLLPGGYAENFVACEVTATNPAGSNSFLSNLLGPVVAAGPQSVVFTAPGNDTFTPNDAPSVEYFIECYGAGGFVTPGPGGRAGGGGAYARLTTTLTPTQGYPVFVDGAGSAAATVFGGEGGICVAPSAHGSNGGDSSAGVGDSINSGGDGGADDDGADGGPQGGGGGGVGGHDSSGGQGGDGTSGAPGSGGTGFAPASPSPFDGGSGGDGRPNGETPPDAHFPGGGAGSSSVGGSSSGNPAGGAIVISWTA